MANDKRRGTVKLSQYNEQAQVAPSATRDRSIVVGFYNAEGTAPVHPGCFTPAEWDAFVAAGNAALGRPATPLADRIASEQTPPVDLSGICSEGREEEVYGLGYTRGRADAAAMAREAGPTVPRGAPIPDAEPLFYIWDTRSFVGDSILWWRPNSSGYTINLDEAGTYTAEQCRGNRETDRPVPVEIARAVCSQHVIAPRLRRALEEAALATPTEGR